MKDLYQVLRQKQLDIVRVRAEIEALHRVIPLLTEDADLMEYGMASPPPLSRFQGTGTTGLPRMKGGGLVHF
ncbi:MAG TPA: hypothetical protein VEV41_02395 [Terriglobales bacterium]|nr:hypothetical protein [Terriglobales bacterium]